jgi:hypothetical protein
MVSQFQGRYLADFDKMAEILGGSTSCAYISHNGAVTPEGKRADGAARVILSSEPHNFIGVVIPLAVTHADDIGCAAEEWATRAWKEPAPGTYPEGLQAHPLA